MAEVTETEHSGHSVWFSDEWRQSERGRRRSRRQGPDPPQSVVVRRYQKRARKSSLQVMKPGLVGECTMQRTMLLCPSDSRFFLSAVRESQQHRLMVRSSGSST